MSKVTKVGVIGTGNISSAYFKAMKNFPAIVEVKAITDLNMAMAQAQAMAFGLEATTVEKLLADPEIGIVLNLTTPQSHTEVNTRILKSGKHAYTEKPYGLTRESGKAVLDLASSLGLKTGGAPDTFLGGGHQTCRKLIDDGAIGKVIAGTAFMMCPGHESWHPNPGFYYLKGGGPLFDMGPYYITALVNMLGPVKKVTAINSMVRKERLATSPVATGKILPVEVNTHVAAVLEFVSGAVITLVTSFDVYSHSNHFIELHGTDGSLKVPNPNGFGGEAELYQPWMASWVKVKNIHNYNENMRSIGLADLAESIEKNRLARCCGELTFHVLDVMCCIEESSAQNKHIEVASTCERPLAMPAGLKMGELSK